MEFAANAKVNLFLDLTGKDDRDGYHFLDSIFAEVSLSDEISMKEAARNEVRFWDEKGASVDFGSATTVHLALSLFQKRFEVKQNYAVDVVKHIPQGAGLGGGSSDAGALLLELGRLHGITADEMLDPAMKVGSDVPYFLYGGICRVEGKGEKITKLGSRLHSELLIVYPDVHVSTKEAYRLVSPHVGEVRGSIEAFLKKEVYNVDFLRDNVYNIFQRFVVPQFQDLGHAYETLKMRIDPGFDFMSGSGSSLVFGYETKLQAEKALECVRKFYAFPAFVCTAVYR